MNSLLLLLISHLVGDFILKPSSWVDHIELHKLKSKYIYFHSVIHGALAWMLLGFQQFPLAIAITIVHFGIDMLKTLNQTDTSKTYWFFLDQLMHIISIIVLSSIFIEDLDLKAFTEPLMSVKLSWWLGLIFLSTPCAFMIKMALQGWSKSLNIDKQENLPNAGLFIGVLERILIYIFILNGSFEAVGFLLTAKSVFRFGDLNNDKDRMRTEYILVGTLLSFTIAIITSMIIKSLL